MLASTLIRRFVGTPNLSNDYRELYARTFATTPAKDGRPAVTTPYASLAPVGPAPSQGHAAAIAKTAIEWADRMDAAGVQVHQEGARARWLGAQHAPTYGRIPGAVAARAATAAFIASCLEAAVKNTRANTFSIPATAHQGASVALTEARASAGAYHAAALALAALPAWGDVSDRPELAAEVEKTAAERKRLEGDAGRAVAMHTTAMAEAIGCLEVAEGGDWLRVIGSEADLATMGEGLVIGVEVVGDIARCLVANLDVQHGGAGTFGLGCKPVGALAACDAAVQVVKSLGRPLPRSTRFVTSRMDPDAIVAAMILSGRLPLELISGHKLGKLAELDNSDPAPSFTWTPGPKGPQTVADDVDWGGLGALTLAYTRGGEGAPSLATLEAGAMALAIGVNHATYPPALLAECGKLDKQVRAAFAAAETKATVRGPIVAALDMPVGAGTFQALYSLAPIVVLLATAFPFRGRAPGAKFTVAVSREAGPLGAEFHKQFRRRIEALEAGWGGPATVTGSPVSGPSRLGHNQVIDIAMDVAVQIGLWTPDPIRSSAPSGLR